MEETVEHQPRERAVSCSRCGKETWNIQPLCDRCSLLPEGAWVERVVTQRRLLINRRARLDQLADLKGRVEAEFLEAQGAYSEALWALQDLTSGEAGA